MATYKKGLHGPASGKFGNMIASSWREIDYIRTRSSKDAKEPTAKQLQIRAKFSVVNTFLNLVNTSVQMAFIHNQGRMTGRNAAQSHILTKAWNETPEGGDIDYPNVLISFGKLEPVTQAEVTSNETGITIKWDKKAANQEQMIIALVDPAEKQSIESVAEVNRQTGEYSLEPGVEKATFNFHVYIGTISKDRKKASNSLYLGCIKYATT